MKQDKNPSEYAFLQDVQPASTNEPQKKKPLWLFFMILAVILVLVVVVAGIILSGGSDDSSDSPSTTQSTVSSEDASVAVALTDSFIRAMSEDNLSRAEALTSPVSESAGVFNENIARSYFGEGLGWSGCQHRTADSYPTYTAEFASVNYIDIQLEYNCQYADGRAVIVTFDMRRAQTAVNEWKFYSATIRDEGLPADVI